jgi:hypothetical protein
MEREIASWENIRDAYRYFTQGRSFSRSEKRDVFAIIMACVNNGVDAALECVTCIALTQDQAGQIRDRFSKGDWKL